MAEQDAEVDVATFRIEVPDAEVADLRARLAATRWPEESPDADWVRGVPSSYLRDLAVYWADGYDWRAQEARLNALPQFVTRVDGQRLHFLHVRSHEAGALPLLITHGWPGSVAEFLDVVGPLTDPASYGGDARDAFHVVAPSIPGYGFSGPVTEPGWDTTRVARALGELMALLGYERYAAQGGDWGSHISREIGRADPEHVVGIHLNMLLQRGSSLPDHLTPDEQDRADELTRFMKVGSGYSAIQGTRPQTLAYALTDSPAGQLAWIADKFWAWTDHDGNLEDAVDRDQLLTNVTIYWFTRTAGSSAQLYYEARRTGPTSDQDIVPTGVAVFPYDIARPIRRVAERTMNIARWTEMPRGGHFAAMEEPDLLVEDVRAFFRELR